MPYKIRKQQYKIAKDLGVEIKSSTRKGKKIDVLRGEDKISIGATGYKDYYKYLETDEELADDRRRAFSKRHNCPDKRKGSAGYYSCRLLW